MKKKKTQLLGIVLSAAMLATSVPAPVYAEPTDNVAEEEDSDAAAVQETTDEADAVADDATDDSTAADDATPEEADEQDTADEADAQAAEEGDNEVKVDGGYTISIPTINFQGANAAVAEQMAKDVEIDESDPAIQSLRKALEEVEIVGGEAGTESNESNISTADLYEADEADGQETTQKLTDEQIDTVVKQYQNYLNQWADNANVLGVQNPFFLDFNDDTDGLEFMDRKPNFWALIPLYCEMLMSSESIPEDYDMSHLRTIGAGAEAMNDRKYAEVEEFFHKHNVQAKLSAGYGQSEGCSNLTLPNPMFPLEDGCVGMPMTATVLGVFDKDLNELNYGESGELCMTGPSMMLHYSGWRGEELTEQTLVEHPDGNTWLHTGDEAYITEQGIVHILGRGEIKAYGDKPLHVMRMETKTVRTPGVKDGFFCLVPDQEHEGYYRPYLFVILDGTKTLEEVAELLKDTLEEHEYPVEIREITERPYFHFKTDRKGLTAQILKELE